jgi:DNA-binding CsgD family transcriptional regulator
MERNEVSVHEARIYVAFLSRKGQWLSNKEIAQAAQVSERTARAHTLKLSRLGVLDLAEVFPAHRYRLADKAGKRNAAYVQRLTQVCEIFGLAVS